MPEVIGRFRHAFAWWRVAVDGEQQMVVNRFIVGIFALCFNRWAASRGLMPGLSPIAPGIYILLGWPIALHLALNPVPSVSRRMVALFLDCAGASYELHIGGAATVWQFAGYLWIIFGNGFRFGSRFQVYAMLIATTGFILMAVVTPYWRDQPAQMFGGLISLTVVPLYALALIKRLSQARQQAEEASRAKSLFLASVSHELRTPLNAVIGMGALLESSDLKPEQVQMSRTIMAAARSLLSLIDGILDLSRAEAGRMAVANSDFNLAQLLNEIKTIFAAQGHLKGVQFNLHVTARTPLLLHGDARKLHEILLNLVGNGMKFTETGGITVAVDVVAQQDTQVRLRFEVTDTGIGIAPEAHERIFDVFTQADETVVNRFGGTGLGLALVRKSVQLLGGEIGVQSAPGVGSTFWVELPLRFQPATENLIRRFTQLRALVLTGQSGIVAPLLGRLTEWGVRVEHIAAPLPDWPVASNASSLCLLAFGDVSSQGGLSFVDVRLEHGEGLPNAEARLSYATVMYLPVTDVELANVLHFVTVTSGCDHAVAEMVRLPVARECFHLLVADDNATNRYVTEKILRSAGHTVMLANNGEEALDVLAEQNFDIAILDVNMPVMDGIEVAKIYRMASAGATIPLMALTADATPVTRERCLEAGMVACLVKPVEPARLLAIIDEVIQQARAAKARRELTSPSSRITEITAHPRFRSNVTSAVDLEVLVRLRDLGGEAFLVEVCELFRCEAQATMLELRAAAKREDILGFRMNAHALRSAAANVGARPLYEICRPFQSASAIEFRQSSPTWLEQIGAELGRVDTALTDYCAGRTAQSGR